MTETCRSRTADRHLLKREKVRVRYFVCLDRSDRSRPHLRQRQQTSPTLYSDFGEYFCALQLPRRTLPLPCALQRLGYCSRHRLYILLYLRPGASKCARVHRAQKRDRRYRFRHPWVRPVFVQPNTPSAIPHQSLKYISHRITVQSFHGTRG